MRHWSSLGCGIKHQIVLHKTTVLVLIWTNFIPRLSNLIHWNTKTGVAIYVYAYIGQPNTKILSVAWLKWTLKICYVSIPLNRGLAFFMQK